MKKILNYAIRIDAPRERVWRLMLDPQAYREWGAPFCEGSYYEGSWDAGARIRFLTLQGEGMVSEVAEHRPREFVSLRHLGMIKDGQEDTGSDAVRAWAPSFENYRFVDRDGGTEVQVEMETLPAWEQFMQDTWPQALARLKALCERAP